MLYQLQGTLSFLIAFCQRTSSILPVPLQFLEYNVIHLTFLSPHQQEAVARIISKIPTSCIFLAAKQKNLLVAKCRVRPPQCPSTCLNRRLLCSCVLFCKEGIITSVFSIRQTVSVLSITISGSDTLLIYSEVHQMLNITSNCTLLTHD